MNFVAGTLLSYLYLVLVQYLAKTKSLFVPLFSTDVNTKRIFGTALLENPDVKCSVKCN